MSRPVLSAGLPRPTSNASLVLVIVMMVVGALLVGADHASGATTQPTFARTDHPSPANSNIAADLNGDGRLDLAGLGFKTAAVLLSSGDGTFGPRTEFPVADFPQDLAAGDFDRDGTWAAVGGRQLAPAGRELGCAVRCGDLGRARELTSTQAGRDPSGLDVPQLCRAAVGSVAEITADAVLGPLAVGRTREPAGVVGYRARIP